MKLKIISICGFLLLIAGVTISIQRSKIRNLEVEKKELVNFNNSEYKKALEWYTTQNGKAAAKVEQLGLSLNNTKELIESERLSFVREIKGLKNNLRNLEEVIKIQAEYQNSFAVKLKDTVVLINNESIVGKNFIWKDSLNYVGGTITKDTAYIDLESQVPLRGGVIWKRKWFLGKKKWEFHLHSTNPYIIITGMEKIKIGKAKN